MLENYLAICKYNFWIFIEYLVIIFHSNEMFLAQKTKKKKRQFKFPSNLSKIFSNRKGRLCHWFCQIWVDDHPQAQAQSQANPASNARLSDCVPNNCLQFILETVGMFPVGAFLGCIQHQPEFLENSTCKLNSWCDILFMNKCL